MEETTSSYEMSPDAAFVGGLTGPGMLFGDPLRPFSFSRKIAAQSMGCTAPAISEGSADAMRSTGLYPGALNDTIIVCWLCALKDSSEFTGDDIRANAFNPDRAINVPAQANQAARAWAETKGLTDLQSPAFVEAYQVFLQIVFKIDASAFEVSVDNGGAPASEAERPKMKPGSRKSPTPSQGSRRPAGSEHPTSGKK